MRDRGSLSRPCDRCVVHAEPETGLESSVAGLDRAVRMSLGVVQSFEDRLIDNAEQGRQPDRW